MRIHGILIYLCPANIWAAHIAYIDLLYILLFYRTMVSFTVDNSALTFEAINMRISLSMETLALLNFNILNLSQGKHKWVDYLTN